MVINMRYYHDFDQIITIFFISIWQDLLLCTMSKKNSSKYKYSLQLFCELEFELFLTYHDDKLSKLKTGNLLTSRLFLSQ
nr:recombination protein O N-terminal domain-containing protein [Spiroplasma mirum]